MTVHCSNVGSDKFKRAERDVLVCFRNFNTSTSFTSRKRFNSQEMLIVEPSHMTEKLPFFRDREDRLGRPPGDDPADVTSAEAVEVTSETRARSPCA